MMAYWSSCTRAVSAQSGWVEAPPRDSASITVSREKTLPAWAVNWHDTGA